MTQTNVGDTIYNIAQTNVGVKYKKGTVNLSNSLKKAREKQGLTQVEVAKKANISESAYQNYESDKRVPNVRTAQLIAQTLNTTVEEIFPVSNLQG